MIDMDYREVVFLGNFFGALFLLFLGQFKLISP